MWHACHHAVVADRVRRFTPDIKAVSELALQSLFDHQLLLKCQIFLVGMLLVGRQEIHDFVLKLLLFAGLLFGLGSRYINSASGILHADELACVLAGVQDDLRVHVEAFVKNLETSGFYLRTLVKRATGQK